MADPEQFVAVREIAPDVSTRTSIAVMKAMALARSQRWESAKEMAEALVEGETAPLEPTTEKPSGPKKAVLPAYTKDLPKEIEEVTPKRKWGWIVALAVILPALAAGGWWLYQSGLLTGGTVAQATQTPSITEAVAKTDVPSPTTPVSTEEPQPTLTPRPSAGDKALTFAEPMLAAIAERPPDYADDFGDPESGWTLVKTTDIEAGYQDGKYVITVEPDYSTSSDATSLPTFADFVIDIDGEFASGDNGYWGVSWYWSENQITGVLIPLSGPVQMVHCEEECSSLGEIREPALNPDYEANHLQIVVKGSEMAIALNGEWQVLATDLYYTGAEGRQIRLEVQNLGDDPLEVRWDNIKIWDISDS